MLAQHRNSYTIFTSSPKRPKSLKEHSCYLHKIRDSACKVPYSYLPTGHGCLNLASQAGDSQKIEALQSLDQTASHTAANSRIQICLGKTHPPLQTWAQPENHPAEKMVPAPLLPPLHRCCFPQGLPRAGGRGHAQAKGTTLPLCTFIDEKCRCIYSCKVIYLYLLVFTTSDSCLLENDILYVPLCVRNAECYGTI